MRRHNRFILALCALVVASSCASSPTTSARAAVGPVLTDIAPVRQSQRLDPLIALRTAGAANAITTAQAIAMFGAPDVRTNEGRGALLVWRLPSCALTLGFANDRLSLAQAGPRRAGETPTLETCVAEARSRAAS